MIQIIKVKDVLSKGKQTYNWSCPNSWWWKTWKNRKFQDSDNESQEEDASSYNDHVYDEITLHDLLKGKEFNAFKQLTETTQANVVGSLIAENLDIRMIFCKRQNEL